MNRDKHPRPWWQSIQGDPGVYTKRLRLPGLPVSDAEPLRMEYDEPYGVGAVQPEQAGRSIRCYFDRRDWWVGYYRGDTHHYVCPLPTLVIRWRRRIG